MSPTEQSSASDRARAAPSKRLRVWLIIVTILGVLGFAVAIPATFLGTYMAAFAADDPSATVDDVWNFVVTVWAIAAGYVVLIWAGVIGGWIAYRKRRNRLSFGLSLLTAVPIFLFVAAIVTVMLMNALWTASV